MMNIQIVLCDESSTDFSEIIDLFPGAKTMSKEEACGALEGDIIVLDHPTVDLMGKMKECQIDAKAVPCFVISNDLSMEFLAASVSSIKVASIFEPGQIDELIRAIGTKINEVVKQRELDKFLEDK